jgi:hypothetical protein
MRRPYVQASSRSGSDQQGPYQSAHIYIMLKYYGVAVFNAVP